MITRREAIRLLGSGSAASFFAAAKSGPIELMARMSAAAKDDLTPPLAPGAPTSPERVALIEAFKKQSEGLEKKFEARTHKSDSVMPYRLFRPEAAGKVPLVVYLHGSGGLGDDNVKQLSLGNIFGTRVWVLPENQKSFPCYVVAPQTDQGWVRYDLSQETPGPAKVLPGLGNGARLALEIIDELCREFAIDERRIYVAGQSMGGAGTWHMITNRPSFFAAAVSCCGSMALGRLTRPCGTFTGTPTRQFPCPCRVTVLQQDGKRAAGPFAPSTLV